MWPSVDSLSCSGICREHGISLGLYLLLPLLRKVDSSLASSARSQIVWALCTKVDNTEKSFAMWSCVLAFRYRFVWFAFLRTPVHLPFCVCQYTTNTVSVSTVHCIYLVYLLVAQEIFSPAPCGQITVSGKAYNPRCCFKNVENTL